MAENLFENVHMACVVCRNPIPPEKDARRASTCSDECLALRKRYYRHRKDARQCRYCLKPSTPEEQKLYKRWRRFQDAGKLLQQMLASMSDDEIRTRLGSSVRELDPKEIPKLRQLFAEMDTASEQMSAQRVAFLRDGRVAAGRPKKTHPEPAADQPETNALAEVQA